MNNAAKHIWPVSTALKLLNSTHISDVQNDVMGIVLCAGVGSRMAPLTNFVPKPLLPALNIPLMFWNVAKLRSITGQISINTHYLHKCFDPLVEICERADMKAGLYYEPQLSGPFGGVLACTARWTGSDAIVMMGDGFFDFNVADLMRVHRDAGNVLTIGVAPVEDGSRYGILSVDENDRVYAMREKPKGIGSTDNASCGVYVISRPGIERFRDTLKNIDWIDVVSEFLRLKTPVGVYRVNTWYDAGNPMDLLKLNLSILTSKYLSRLAFADAIAPNLWTQDDSQLNAKINTADNVLVGETVKFHGRASVSNSIIGQNSTIGENVTIENAIILPGSQISTGSILDGVIWSRA